MASDPRDRPSTKSYREEPDTAGQNSRGDTLIFINGHRIECFDDYDFINPSLGVSTTTVKIDDCYFEGTYAEAVALCMKLKPGNRSMFDV